MRYLCNILNWGELQKYKSQFLDRGNTAWNFVWKTRVCSGNPPISKILQTVSGKSFQKRTGSAAGPCCSWEAQAAPKSCRADEGNYKWERSMLKASSVFKIRANNIKGMDRPLYSEIFLQQSSKCHPSQTKSEKGEGLKELPQDTSSAQDICSAPDKPVMCTAYNTSNSN